MPEWLVAYLAFSLAGGITTYLTVLKEADRIYQEVTEDSSKLGIFSFIAWNIASLVIAPILLLIVVRNKTEDLTESIATGWVENARCDD